MRGQKGTVLRQTDKENMPGDSQKLLEIHGQNTIICILCCEQVGGLPAQTDRGAALGK